MKKLLLVLALACGFACAAIPIKWPDLVQCGGDIGNLVGTVTQILLNDTGSGDVSPSARAKLEQLAVQHGAESVVCVVSSILGDWSKPGAAMPPERIAAMSRAQGWMNSTGSRVLRPNN
jgi:hypothetical protein